VTVTGEPEETEAEDTETATEVGVVAAKDVSCMENSAMAQKKIPAIGRATRCGLILVVRTGRKTVSKVSKRDLISALQATTWGRKVGVEDRSPS